jgi:hypothetical protein
VAERTYALDTVDGLVDFLDLWRQNAPAIGMDDLRGGRIHCTTCSREMTMHLGMLLAPPARPTQYSPVIDTQTLAPSVF